MLQRRASGLGTAGHHSLRKIVVHTMINGSVFID